MTGVAARAEAATEIRMTMLHATRGKNFWSLRPVTRMDLQVGAFDEISSAEAPGTTERLVAAMPGLVEHRCSIGERGGFIVRLRRGTYAPHIIEHVALELQTMMGHEVGGVTFVDGRDSVRFDNAHDLERGRQLTLSHLRVGIVGTNYHLNLEHRELDLLVRGEPSAHVRAGARAPAGGLPASGARRATPHG